MFFEGDEVEQVLMLISGSVKITQLGPKGLAVILRLGAAGDVLDTASLFLPAGTVRRPKSFGAAGRSSGTQGFSRL